MMYREKGSRNLISATKDSFIYELSIYSREDNIISIIDTQYIKSDKFVKDRTIAPKKSNIFKHLNLIAAPERWLDNNDYEQVEDDIFVLKKWKKKKKQ